jgi:hypothetical protein
MATGGQRFFKRPTPTSPDVHRIWADCCLADVAEVTDIYWALDTWARLNCSIDMREGRPYVFWVSPTGVRHECYADTFAHWFLCGCEEMAATPIQPLTPNGEVNVAFPLEPVAEEVAESTDDQPSDDQPSDENQSTVGNLSSIDDQPSDDNQSSNEIIFHEIQKIGDDADQAVEKTLMGVLASEPILTFEEIVHMNLEQFLNESTESE